MNTSGYSSVTFRGLFAAGNEFGPGSSAYDADDYLKVFYSTNGGVTWENGVWFSYENHGDGFNEPIGLNTDFDGQADVNGSDRLGIVFTEYTFSISGNPSSVMIHVETHMDSGDEEIAYDNLRIEGTAAVPDPEPSEQPTALTTERTACNGLEVSFTDAGGAQLPAGYLLVASDGVIAAPIDGTDPADDTDLSDGDAVVHIAHGSGGTYSFDGLNSTTNYNFQVWFYTNGGANIDYLTAPAGPSVSETILTPLLLVDFSVCPPAEVTENFDNSAGGTGDVWQCSTVFENIEANAFGDSEAGNMWYILNGINLNNSTDENLSFESRTRFTDAVPGFEVKYSTDYSGSGDPDAASWTDLNPTLPAADSQV